MRLGRTLSSGFLDAGFSSLATFAIGVEAARRLEPAALGGYAIVFAVFLLATVVPAQLVFLPAEVRAVSLAEPERFLLLPSALRHGLPVALAGSCAVGAAVIVMPSSVPQEVVLPLVLTAAAAALVSPVQDHLRRLLHVAGASAAAASVSMAQFVGVLATLLVLSWADVPAAWLPFGALLAANVLSSAVAAVHVRRRRQGDPVRLARRDLTRSGGWLLVVGLAPAGAGFAAAAVIGVLAGPSALGHAEAARVVGQPLLVVAMGLGAVLGPRSIAAAAGGDLPQRRRLRRVFAVALTAAAGSSLLLVGPEWGGNPALQVLPNAYAVSGLVAVTVLANLVNGLAFPYRYELLGLRAERSAAGGELAGGLVQTVLSLSAALVGGFARPLGLIGLGLTRLVLFRRVARRQGPGIRASAGSST